MSVASELLPGGGHGFRIATRLSGEDPQHPVATFSEAMEWIAERSEELGRLDCERRAQLAEKLELAIENARAETAPAHGPR